MGVDLSIVSLSLSLRSFVSAFGPFLATLADTYGRKYVMLGGVTLFVMGCVFVVIWPAIFPFMVAMILIAFGKAVFDPSLHAYVGDEVPYRQRALAVAIIEMSWSLSFILGIPFMGYLINRYGWASPFTLLGVLGIGTLLILHRVVPTDAYTFEGESNRYTQIWKKLHLVLSDPLARAGIIIGLLTATANECINIIFGVWIEDTFGLQLAALGVASAVIGFSELFGEGLVGMVTDRLGKIRAITLGIILNSLAALILPTLGSTLIGVLIGLFFFYITFEFTLVSTIPIMTEILPGARATLLATGIAAFSLGRAAGAAIAVPLYSQSIWANSIAATAFNFLALFILFRMADALKTRTSLV